jgi:hypothetical protein
MDNFSLALPLDSDAPEFIRGVELGRLWEILKQTDEPVEEMIHTTNAEMALRVAEATGRDVRSEEMDDRWLWVKFGAAA